MTLEEMVRPIMTVIQLIIMFLVNQEMVTKAILTEMIVDIRKDSSHYEQYYVSDIEDGEWLQYTVNATTPGIYTLRIYVASPEKREP